MQNSMPGKPTLAASRHTPLLLLPQAVPAVVHTGGSTAAASIEQNLTPPSSDIRHISPGPQLSGAGAPPPPARPETPAMPPAAPAFAEPPAPACGAVVVPAAPLMPAVPTPAVPLPAVPVPAVV